MKFVKIVSSDDSDIFCFVNANRVISIDAIDPSGLWSISLKENSGVLWNPVSKYGGLEWYLCDGQFYTNPFGE